MAWFKDELLPVLRHSVGTFIAAIVIFFAAIGLAKVEGWCRDQKMPEYICYGIRAIAFTIFTLEGILICGIVAIVVIKLLRKTWKHDLE